MRLDFGRNFREKERVSWSIGQVFVLNEGVYIWPIRPIHYIVIIIPIH